MGSLIAASYSALVILFSSNIRLKTTFRRSSARFGEYSGFMVEGALGKPAMIAISESVNSSKFLPK